MKKAKILCALLSILLLFSVLGVLFSNVAFDVFFQKIHMNQIISLTFSQKKRTME